MLETGGRRKILTRLPGTPERIITAPLLRIAQYLIGLIDLLEALFGGWIVLACIGVAFARQFPVSLLDLFLARVPFNP